MLYWGQGAFADGSQFFAYTRHRLKADASVQSEARFAGWVAVAVGFKPMAAKTPNAPLRA
jgi:hypothetical protein